MKYQLVYDTLKIEIVDGIHAEGELLPTELELTERFGASRPTIAKALDMLRMQKAIQRCAGFGTVVLKSELTRGKAVGLLIPRLGQTEIFEPICAAMDKAGMPHCLRFIRPPSNENDIAAMTQRLCTQFIRDAVSGVIFTPVEHVPDYAALNASILDQLKAVGIPVVLLDRDAVDWPAQTSHDLVGIDNIQAGFVVAGHLLDQGCERIVFATHPAPAMTVQLRIMGCREALLQREKNPEVLVVQEIPENDPALIRRHDPDGLICANDATAAELMRALIDAGTAIPEQLKVAAFDDVKYASLLSVPLTTYQQPCREIGTAVVDALMLRIEHPDSAARRTTLQGRLIPRKSTERLSFQN